LKNVGKIILKIIVVVLIISGLKKALEYSIPFAKNHGVEYNKEREKLQIPTLSNDWEIDEHQSTQFETQWWKPYPRNGHFKKIIEYGIFNINKETDYYQNDSLEKTFAWSIYYYDKNEFEYYLQEPNENRISTDENGKINYLKSNIDRKVNKSEFDKYLAE
jgi:hypothetical protein